MAITFVNSSSGANLTGSSVSSLSTSAINCTTGNLIVVGLRATIPTSVTDTAGNTYVQINQVAASNIGDVSLWYAKNITGNASNVITANFSPSAAFLEIIACQYSGLDTTSPLDINGTKNQSTDSTSVTSDAFTTNYANEVIVGFATQNTSVGDYTPGTGYTERVDIQGSAFQDKIVSSIQTSVTMTMTSNQNVKWGLVFASFRESGVEVAPPALSVTATLNAPTLSLINPLEVAPPVMSVTATLNAPTLSIFGLWTTVTRNISSFTAKTKNSTSFTARPKNSGIWTPKNKS